MASATDTTLPTKRPDRVTIVALDDDRYQADVSFRGAAAQLDALHLDDHLRAQRLRCDVREDSSGSWTVRVRPSEASLLIAVLRDVLA